MTKDVAQIKEEEEEDSLYCSFAVTGEHPWLQAIYVCQQCHPPNASNESTNDTPPPFYSLCTACAEYCHEDHVAQLLYIGVGPSYCDCHRLVVPPTNSNIGGGPTCGCRLQESSKKKAQSLQIHSPVCLPTNSTWQTSNKSQLLGDYQCRVYDMEALLPQPQQPQQPPNKDIVESLHASIHALVHKSRETFWIDSQFVADHVHALCDLEWFAWRIYCQHTQTPYLVSKSNTTMDDPPSNTNTTTLANACCGAEWWVQVKPVHHETTPISTTTTDGRTTTHTHDTKDGPPSNLAIDLHYDKDEELAEAFGLGFFPTLSTVTYLTEHVPSTTSYSVAPPTIVLSHRYDESMTAADGTIHELLVSHPRQGKHLVFDGRLLHGAPAHSSLRERDTNNTSTTEADTSKNHDTAYRITFLVNLWSQQKPAGISPLSDSLRQFVKDQRQCPATTTHDLSLALADTNFIPRTIVEHDVTDDSAPSNGESHNDDDGSERIDLPFVGHGTTWGGRTQRGTEDNDNGKNQEDDPEEDAALFVSIVSPPYEKESNDTVLYRYGPSLGAYIYSPNDEESDEEDEEGG